VAAYPRTKLGSDHNCLIRTFKFEAKELISKTRTRHNISSVRDTQKHEMLKDELDKHIRFNNNDNEDKNIEEQWRNIKNNIHNALEKVLGYKRKERLR
jgi:thioredoxin reductase